MNDGMLWTEWFSKVNSWQYWFYQYACLLYSIVLKNNIFDTLCQEKDLVDLFGFLQPRSSYQ